MYSTISTGPVKEIFFALKIAFPFKNSKILVYLNFCHKTNLYQFKFLVLPMHSHCKFWYYIALLYIMVLVLSNPIVFVPYDLVLLYPRYGDVTNLIRISLDSSTFLA